MEDRPMESGEAFSTFSIRCGWRWTSCALSTLR